MPGTYETSFANTKVEFPVDQGLAKTSASHSNGFYPIKGTLRLNGAQLSALRSFHKVDLSGGTVMFLFPNPEGGAALAVRFGPTPPAVSALRLKNRYDVAIELEVFP